MRDSFRFHLRLSTLGDSFGLESPLYTSTMVLSVCLPRKDLKWDVAASRRLATRTKESSKPISKSSKRSQIAMDDAVRCTRARNLAASKLAAFEIPTSTFDLLPSSRILSLHRRSRTVEYCIEKVLRGTIGARFLALSPLSQNSSQLPHSPLPRLPDMQTRSRTQTYSEVDRGSSSSIYCCSTPGRKRRLHCYPFRFRLFDGCGRRGRSDKHNDAQ